MTTPSRQRTIVVTGATSGLGLHIARQLNTAGHQLILLGRDPARAEQLRRTLPASTVVTADLASRPGIVTAVTAITGCTTRVDTLINNAGVMLPHRTVNDAGIEMNRAIHHLAPHHLTAGLLPLLQHDDARVINVNSAGHRSALFTPGPVELDLTDLDSARSYDPFLAYSRSKLANLLDTYEFQRQHPAITFAAVHPGMVRTDLGRHFPRIKVAAMHAMSIPGHKGAEPITHLATAPAIARGSYYDRFTLTTSSPQSYDQITAARLWTTTA